MSPASEVPVEHRSRNFAHVDETLLGQLQTVSMHAWREARTTAVEKICSETSPSDQGAAPDQVQGRVVARCC